MMLVRDPHIHLALKRYLLVSHSHAHPHMQTRHSQVCLYQASRLSPSHTPPHHQSSHLTRAPVRCRNPDTSSIQRKGTLQLTHCLSLTCPSRVQLGCAATTLLRRGWWLLIPISTPDSPLPHISASSIPSSP